MAAAKTTLLSLPLLVAGLLTGFWTGAVAAAGPTLRVVVTGVQTDAGNVVVWVYDKPDDWLSDRVLMSRTVPVHGNRTGDAITVDLVLAPGEYALSVFQDLNADGKLARNFIGIPKEPAGLSNNAVPRFGPPKYKDARFRIETSPVEQRIKLK